MKFGVKTFLRVGLSFAALASLLFFVFSAVKGNATVKPLVYIIPTDFIGPVFVFFGQADGKVVVPDPFGNTVTIPHNGVLKLKGTVDDLIGKDGTVQNVYWVTTTKEGARRNLWIVNDPQRDSEGNWIYSYYDEVGKLHHATGENPNGYFNHIPAAKRDDRMIMAHDGCKHQRFVPADAPDASIPACAKFLIISPNGYNNMPDWLWLDTGHEYTSISELEAEAAERSTKLTKLTGPAKTSLFGLAK